MLRLPNKRFGLRFAVLFSVLIPSAALSQATRLAGAWKGYWTRAGHTLPVTMVVRRGPRRLVRYGAGLHSRAA
jgi:hypothetical protein